MRPFGSGVGRICGVAAAATARELRVLLKQALRYTRTVELRLDWLRSDQERQKFLSWLKDSRPKGAVLVATCRRRIGGGEFAGDAGAELYWLMKAGRAGCQWCDLEVETLREVPGKSVEGCAIPPKVMLSMHDFRRTPKLPKKLSVPPHGGVDAIKMAAMSRTIGDSVRLLKVLSHSRQLIAVPWGEIGLPARLLALREGSALAYAPMAAKTAPGQDHAQDARVWRDRESHRALYVSLAAQHRLCCSEDGRGVPAVPGGTPGRFPEGCAGAGRGGLRRNRAVQRGGLPAIG